MRIDLLEAKNANPVNDANLALSVITVYAGVLDRAWSRNDVEAVRTRLFGKFGAFNDVEKALAKLDPKAAKPLASKVMALRRKMANEIGKAEIRVNKVSERVDRLNGLYDNA